MVERAKVAVKAEREEGEEDGLPRGRSARTSMEAEPECGVSGEAAAEAFAHGLVERSLYSG